MDADSLRRRLAVVLYADVAGYSRLMGEDEERTHRSVSACLDTISECIERFGGRVGHYAGDAVLADFDLVADALSCALLAQRDLLAMNEGVPEQQRVQFRMGLNLGEVIVDRGEVYGDGVNIAARLEALAEPGGICVSETVRAAAGARSPVEFEFLGERSVKNIAEPVRAYAIRLRDGAQLPSRPRRYAALRRRWSYAAAGIAVALLIALGTGWYLFRPALLGDARVDYSVERPSVAVLPLVDAAAKEGATYFADGITNDIIFKLSRFSNLIVIASNSVFAYRGQQADIREVARDLGVRYVATGRLHRMGTRLRADFQLIDASTGRSLWSERFERTQDDLFDLQEEVARSIVRALAVRLTKLERQRAFSKPTESLQAYEYVLRGQAHLAKLDRKANFEARDMFRRAIDIDAGYADAYAGLGSTYHEPVLWGWTGSPTRDLERALELAQHALSLDDTSLGAHRLIARIHMLRGEYDAALVRLEQAIRINPNDARSHAEQGVTLLYAGQATGAVRELELALRLDPGMGGDYVMHLGMSYFLAGRVGDAVTTLEHAVAMNPENVFVHIVLAATYARSGRMDEARREAAEVRRLDPFFEIEDYGGIFRSAKDAAVIVDGLRAAGFE